MNPTLSSKAGRLTAVFFAALTLAGCWERPPIDSYQRGPRGTAMVEFNNPRLVPAQLEANRAPDPAPAADASGPPASTVYKNVQVLGNLSVGEFTRTMVSLTSWVAPNEGCNYCHKPGESLDSDALYTKVVARKMLQMTQAINSENTSHVGATGVTCYTCHRGQPVPAQVWFAPPAAKTASRMMGGDGTQNKAAADVGLTSMPTTSLVAYLSGTNTVGTDIRVAGTTALPQRGDQRNKNSIQHTESTYALMIHMSEGLGVNCTYCHNTQSFGSWSTSTPQRVTAWHGIRMVRSLNQSYLEPLTSAFPTERKGPTGDVAKVNCATCHQGQYKPLFGAPMAKHYPALYKANNAVPPAATTTAAAAQGGSAIALAGAVTSK